MNDKFEKRNKFMHFLEKWLIIGLILFVVIQLTALKVIDLFLPEGQEIVNEQYEEYNNDYLGHWYNGTFFINMTIHENFESDEQYKLMIKEIENDMGSKVCSIIGKTASIGFLVFILIAAYKEHKNKLLEGNTPNYIIIGALFCFAFKIFEEIDLFIDVSYWSKYSRGFLSTASYYLQLHLFILPLALLLLGLILRQKQRKDLKLFTKNNEKFIKTVGIIMLLIGLSFILYRFGIRVYELININSNHNIRLPFYYYIFDLPRNFAKSPSAYSKLIILRFIKDLSIFVCSFISLVLFFKIIMSSIEGKIVSKENNKRYKIILIMFIVASLIFNILGIFEVKLFNNEFLYQYENATYTIAVRSLTEPLLYVFFLYLFKHYIEIGYLKNKSK